MGYGVTSSERQDMALNHASLPVPPHPQSASNQLETFDRILDYIVRKIGWLNYSRVAITNGGRQPGHHSTLVMGSRTGRGDDAQEERALHTIFTITHGRSESRFSPPLTVDRVRCAHVSDVVAKVLTEVSHCSHECVTQGHTRLPS